jgi:hypothetical protein
MGQQMGALIVKCSEGTLLHQGEIVPELAAEYSFTAEKYFGP